MSQRYEFTSFGLGETTQDGFLGTGTGFSKLPLGCRGSALKNAVQWFFPGFSVKETSFLPNLDFRLLVSKCLGPCAHESVVLGENICQTLL